MTVTDLAIRDENHYLATVDEIRDLALRIESVGDAKSLADKARAAQVWAERARLGGDQVNLAAIAKLWAERRAGELLRDARDSGERATGGRQAHASESPAATLNDLGVTKQESSRWQQLAEIPQPDFEQALEDASQNGQVTATAVKRLAVPVSEELLAEQQRQTLVGGVDRALRALEFSEGHARAEARRLMDTGGAGDLLPSRFDKVSAFAAAFADELRKRGING